MGNWYSVTATFRPFGPGSEPVQVLNGIFYHGQDAFVTQFFNSSDLTRSVLLEPGAGIGGINDNFFDGSVFSSYGVGLCSIPWLDQFGLNSYALYFEGDTALIAYGVNGVFFQSIEVNYTFTVVPPPAPSTSTTFKPKAMNYADYLRTKKAGATNIISTRPKMDASDYTQRQRFAASQVFPVNGQRIGVVNTSMELTQDPLKQVNSYQKTSGGRVGDASLFSAFRGGQAVGTKVQGDLNNPIYLFDGRIPDRIVQEPVVYFQSPPVSQRASDITRQVQGCKVSLGEQHDAESLTAPVFVDNTIRNIGGGAVCRDVQAIHVSEKADTPLFRHPDRPSQAGGQYAIKGDLAPGKELGARGGNPHYKVGAALRKFPYVEKHHGNDLNVNPKQPFVRYQIPGGNIPAHLKANMPICTIRCRGGFKPAPPCPDISLALIATTSDGGTTYTLKDNTEIAPCQTILIPTGVTLIIPSGKTLTNSGTLTITGTLTNNGTLINSNKQAIYVNAGGNLTTNNSATFKLISNVFNYGTITVGNGTLLLQGTVHTYASSTVAVTAGATVNIDTTSTIINEASSAFSVRGTVNVYGNVFSRASATCTVYGTGLLALLGNSFDNFGTLAVSAGGRVNMSGGELVCEATGILNNNGTSFTVTNSGKLTTKTGTQINNYGSMDMAATFTNNGTFITYGSGGTFVGHEAISNYGTFENRGTTTFDDQCRFTNLASGTLYAHVGTITCNNGLDNYGTLTVAATLETNANLWNKLTGTITNTGTITTNSVFTNNGTLTNSHTFNCDDYVYNYGTITNSGASASFIINDASAIGKRFANIGTFNNAKVFTVGADGNFDTTGVFNNNAGGNVHIYGRFNMNSPSSIFTINLGSTFTLNSGSTSIMGDGQFINYDVVFLLAPIYIYGGSILNKASGSITINNAGDLSDQGGDITNDGTITVNNGGSLSTYYYINKAFTSTATSTITINTGGQFISRLPFLLAEGGTIANNGSISMGDGNNLVSLDISGAIDSSNGSISINTCAATVSNTGTVIAGKVFSINNTATLDNFNSITITSTGTLQTDIPSTFTNKYGATLFIDGGTFYHYGTLVNYGTILDRGSFATQSDSTVTNDAGGYNTDPGVVFVYGEGSLTNDGTFFQNGILYVADGTLGCQTGYLYGKNQIPLTDVTGAVCPP